MKEINEVLQKGLVHAQQGQYQAACGIYEQGLDQYPQCAQIHSSMATALAHLGHTDHAEKHYQTALALQNNQPETWNNLGLLYQQRGQQDKALDHFRRALKLRPDYAHALNNLGTLLLEMNRTQEAWITLHHLTEQHPDQASGWSNLGLAYQKQDQLDRALTCFARAIELDNNSAIAHLNMGNIYRIRRQCQQAIQYYRRAIKAQSDYTPAYAHLAGLLAEQKQFEPAVSLYEQALQLDPDDALSHFNLGTLYLKLGRYKDAWPHYHWRKRCHFAAARYPHPLSGAAWQGQPLQGQRLLIYGEQGIGDILQCLRYLKWAKERGATLIFEIRQELWRLLKDHPYVDECILFDPEQPTQYPYDLHASIVDLPGLAQTTQNSIPPCEPALQAPTELQRQWRHIRDRRRLQVAVVYSGNPHNVVNEQRSIPAQLLAPLVRSESVHLISLQKGSPVRQLQELGWDLPDLGSQCMDFADTAAIIAHVDLVITVCTSVAHLAGAMGKPVWILLHDNADWRWHLETARSPWYPTARLFRQSQPGDWHSVIKRVAEALSHIRPGVHPASSSSVVQQRSQVTARRLQQQAMHSLRQKDYQRALDKIDGALALQDNLAQLHLTRAVIQEHLLRPQLAQRSYRDALLLNPHLPHAWNNLAILQQQQGRTQEAMTTCRQGLEQNPQAADLHHTLGYCLHQSGQDEMAEVHYQQACQLDGNHAEAANHLGVLMAQQGRTEEAMACYHTALQRDPDYAEAANNYGLALRTSGQLAAAQAQFRHALMAQPGFAEAHYNLAGLLHEMDCDDQAVIHCHRALKLRPAYGAAYNQLGIILHHQGHIQQALQAHEQAVRLDPQDAEFNNNLGILLKQVGQFEHAECHYQQAIAREPEFSQAHYNLGNLYRDWGRIEPARECYDRAVTLDPNYANAHWNRSMTALLAGDLDQGWADYHWRHQTSWAGNLYPHRYDQPRWDGRPFPNQRLLVYCEQGQGDAIQFVRYLPMVKAAGGQVLLETWPHLQSLLASAAGVDELYVTQADVPCQARFDWVISMMDLPYVFKTRLTTIPCQVPYLETDAGHVQQWRQRFRTPNLKVGLVWAGSPKHGNDQRRSVPLHYFAETLAVPGVSFYSLQKGPAAQQCADLPAQLRPLDLGQHFKDFQDTANAIAALDLVISVDTAPAHLAGALRKPVWTLLPFAPDWRWMTQRSDCPWYPSMRLYRQPSIDDWDSVFTQLATDLADWARHHNPV